MISSKAWGQGHRMVGTGEFIGDGHDRRSY